MAWFLLNHHSVRARSFLYSEIPTHYSFLRTQGIWTPKVRRGNVISRLYSVSPRDEERFFLRLVLPHIRGATSFEDLRTINDAVYPTFREAAIAPGLTESDAEWFFVMNQASLFSMLRSLRRLFVTICLFCQPSNCLRIFNNFLELMCADFSRNYPEVVARNMCIFYINERLIALNSSNAALGLPLARCGGLDSELAVNLVPNDRQQSVCNAAIDALHNGNLRDRCSFVNELGGSRKTIVCRKICADLWQANILLICVASTGIASTLLPS